MPFDAPLMGTAAVTVPGAPLTRRARRALRAENTAVEDVRTATPEPPDSPTDSWVVDAAGGLTAEEIDAFDVAARLFSFTAETPVQAPADARRMPAADRTAADEASDIGARVATHRIRVMSGSTLRKVAAASFSVGVMGIVGLLTVGLTTPAEALSPVDGVDISGAVSAGSAGDVASSDDDIQAYVTPAEMHNPTIDRPETYSTVTMAEIAAESGISNYSNFFSNDPNAAIQWPFAVGVPISHGFGMRDGTMHEGVDFTPGAGAPIQAIADGIVRESTDSGGAFGVHMVIDHVIDGVLVSSSYSHMLYGSREVQAGDHVTVGTIVGRTGNTGRSFGAHTHFEMLANGTTPIDPIPWLREHAGG